MCREFQVGESNGDFNKSWHFRAPAIPGSYPGYWIEAVFGPKDQSQDCNLCCSSTSTTQIPISIFILIAILYTIKLKGQPTNFLNYV